MTSLYTSFDHSFFRRWHQMGPKVLTKQTYGAFLNSFNPKVKKSIRHLNGSRIEQADTKCLSYLIKDASMKKCYIYIFIYTQT